MRNGGRTDTGIGLIDAAGRQVTARIPHPTSLALGHLPPGEGFGAYNNFTNYDAIICKRGRFILNNRSVFS